MNIIPGLSKDATSLIFKELLSVEILMLHRAFHFEGVATEQMIKEAVSTGNLKLIKLALGMYPGEKPYRMVQWAGKYGKLNVLTWLNRNRYTGMDAAKKAIRNGHIHIVVYLYTIYPEDFRPNCLMHHAIREGQLEIAKWLHSKGLTFTQYEVFAAAERGHLELLKWLKLTFVIDITSVLIGAVRNNHFELAKWAHQSGAKLSDDTFQKACEVGDFEMVKYFYSNSLTKTTTFIKYAVIHGHLEIAKSLHARGQPLEPTDICYPVRLGHIACAEWMLRNGSTIDMLSLGDSFFFNKPNMDVVDWMLKRGIKVSQDDLQMLMRRGFWELHQKLTPLAIQ